MASFINLLKLSIKEGRKDNLPRLAAALSYYAIFSLAPLLILTIAITGILFQDSLAEQYIINETRINIGPEVSNLLSGIINQSYEEVSHNIITSVIATIILLVAATGVFRQIKEALNRIWDVKSKKSKKWALFLARNILAAITVIATGLLLATTVFITAAFSFVQESGLLPGSGIFQIFEFLDIFFSFAIITLIAAAFFKFFPDRKLQWSDVFPGAILSSALFVVGKYFIGIYVGLSSFASSYGAAGAVLILLFWIYVSAILFLFGAEFNKILKARVK